MVLVGCTCVAVGGAWRLVQEDEYFLSITALGLALGFMVVSVFVVRSRVAVKIPWFSVFHITFWILQAAHALHSGSARHAINAHQRLIGHRHPVVWVVMGSVGGFYPGTVRSKIVLFVGSAFFITMRNVMLALRWEESQADGRAMMLLLSDLRDATLGYATSVGAAHSTRLSTELFVNGSYSFVGPSASPPEQISLSASQSLFQHDPPHLSRALIEFSRSFCTWQARARSGWASGCSRASATKRLSLPPTRSCVAWSSGTTRSSLSSTRMLSH